MKKRRFNKWDIAGVSLALVLFVVLASFRAYVSGTLLPHNCKYHPEALMRRVWISGKADEKSYTYTRFGNSMKFMHNPCQPHQASCPLTSYQFVHDRWNFYFYCPDDIYCGDGLCN